MNAFVVDCVVSELNSVRTFTCCYSMLRVNMVQSVFVSCSCFLSVVSSDGFLSACFLHVQ